jgi:geranylgeranyl diphosphate synthase type II
MTFKQYYNKKLGYVNTHLKKTLQKNSAPALIKKAMNYSLMAGGKRLRPVLVLMIDDIIKRNTKLTHSKEIIQCAAAIECIHTYSLIHDDLPAMDDDDFRR